MYYKQNRLSDHLDLFRRQRKIYRREYRRRGRAVYQYIAKKERKKKYGLESGVRRVVAHVRDELHQELEGHRCAVGNIHHMLRDNRCRGFYYT